MSAYRAIIPKATILSCVCAIHSCYLPYSCWVRRFTQLFSHIDIPPEQVNILNGTVQDLIGECAAYEKRIKDVGGIDLFLAGIGEDGHLAFNEPGLSQYSCRFSYLLTSILP